MMDSMRNAAKSWLAKLLIGLLAVSFGVWGIADVFNGLSRGALATVGDVEISGEDFNQSFSQYLQNYARQTGQQLSPEDARKLGIDRAVLNNLIQSAAIDNQSQAMKLSVSNEYLALAATQNPAFQDSAGKFDKDLFRRLLASNGVSEAGYFQEERQRLLREAVTGTADKDIPVPQSMVEAQYRFRNEQRDARFFVIKTSDSDVTPATDEEIKKEYDGNAAAYTAPEYRSIAIMKVEPADLAANITLSDAEITSGYEKYKGDYFTPEKRTILQLSFPTLEDATAAKDKLAAGADFLALAKEMGFSETDVTFADKTKREFFDPAIAEAAFGLAEGAISDPIKGALATVLLKAEKVAPEHQSTLQEIKLELIDRLKLEHAREEIQSIHDAVEDARAAQTKFEDIASKAAIPFQLIAASDASGKDRDGKDITMPAKSELLRASFNSDVGVDNNTISLDDGYVWYEVREVVPSALRPFDTVKESARSAVIANKVREKSRQTAAKLVERAQSGAALEDLAKEMQAEIRTVQGLKREESDANFDPVAVAAIFSVPENGFAFAVERDGRTTKVMQSQAVLLPPFDAASADAKSINDQLKGAAANDVMFAYLGALQKETGVTINETLWRQISGTQTQ